MIKTKFVSLEISNFSIAFHKYEQIWLYQRDISNIVSYYFRNVSSISIFYTGPIKGSRKNLLEFCQLLLCKTSSFRYGYKMLRGVVVNRF